MIGFKWFYRQDRRKLKIEINAKTEDNKIYEDNHKDNKKRSRQNCPVLATGKLFFS
jgi:hypothetical protein